MKHGVEEEDPNEPIGHRAEGSRLMFLQDLTRVGTVTINYVRRMLGKCAENNIQLDSLWQCQILFIFG